ncbi:MAG: DUF4349 domain-containing protein [Chloroflexota bacterium]|nr:DUF4349 domain-containing protein [Chloroflexota bacterium]
MNHRRISLAALIALPTLLVAACAGAAGLPTAGGGDVELVGRPVGAPAAGPTAAPNPGNNSNGNAIPDQQLIVYNGSLDLEVADVNAAVSQAESVIKGLGGHVAASRASDSGDGKSAYVTYRIPAERWADALNGLKGLAKRIVDEQTSSEDVTAQVVDLDARLTNLRSTESALQGIMTRATTITDVLKVQSELTQVRGEIESITAQRDLLANRAALATLEVGFNPPPVAEVTQASTGWDLGKEIDNALASLVRIAQGALSLLIWLLIVVLPVLIPVVIVIWVINRLYVRWRRTHPAAQPAVAPPSEWPRSM